MTGQASNHRAAWLPQNGFAARIASARQLQSFNDLSSFAINFDVLRSVKPDIQMIGSKSSTLCLWETRSSSGFISKPRVDSDMMTVRFIANGHITYRNHAGRTRGTPKHATLVGFEEVGEIQASQAFNAINGTITFEALAAANAALTGGQHGVPSFEPIADVSTPGMIALFHMMQQVQRRGQASDRGGDIAFPLIQEILSYQLLSVWPKRTRVAPAPATDASASRFGIALEFIEANLSRPMTLSLIATAAGLSVRSLQSQFRQRMGQTAIAFITERRLARTHKDLTSAFDPEITIAEIARRWGFVHMSDFGQRYRRAYGRTPSEARRDAGPRG
ncbi:helix-turn-helix domain-containing protein [Methylobacterium sp. E-016]|uniref:AraC family transcriptional regulator n=1 Tax=unclassified Methylobacterium TaxID=2615210 RepID=UPI00164F0F59|nr:MULTISPECIES: helix-turn-helix transcriptional regulator [unclassified Methylobacterium]MCJ2075912.1 helix-turn-helix domain-containing protein [Methylobacterium sp. E-016]